MENFIFCAGYDAEFLRHIGHLAPSVFWKVIHT